MVAPPSTNASIYKTVAIAWATMAAIMIICGVGISFVVVEVNDDNAATKKRAQISEQTKDTANKLDKRCP